MSQHARLPSDSKPCCVALWVLPDFMSAHTCMYAYTTFILVCCYAPPLFDTCSSSWSLCPLTAALRQVWAFIHVSDWTCSICRHSIPADVQLFLLATFLVGNTRNGPSDEEVWGLERTQDESGSPMSFAGCYLTRISLQHVEAVSLCSLYAKPWLSIQELLDAFTEADAAIASIASSNEESRQVLAISWQKVL